MNNHINREDAKECVGKGWSGLIDEIYDLISPEVCIFSIKEKYGGLRINGYGFTSEEDDKIDEICNRSETVCEVCGEKGEPRDLPWILTLCDKCYKEKINKK